MAALNESKTSTTISIKADSAIDLSSINEPQSDVTSFRNESLASVNINNTSSRNNESFATVNVRRSPASNDQYAVVYNQDRDNSNGTEINQGYSVPFTYFK